MIDIRDETPRDSKAVYQVIASAFGQSAEAELVKALQQAGDKVISLVADEDSQIVGHILLSKMTAPFPALALAPISVIPAKQRCGIGSALVTKAVNRARHEGWAAIFVLGDPHYYERFGFSREAASNFNSPYAGPTFHDAHASPIASRLHRRTASRASLRRSRLTRPAASATIQPTTQSTRAILDFPFPTDR